MYALITITKEMKKKTKTNATRLDKSQNLVKVIYRF